MGAGWRLGREHGMLCMQRPRSWMQHRTLGRSAATFLLRATLTCTVSFVIFSIFAAASSLASSAAMTCARYHSKCVSVVWNVSRGGRTPPLPPLILDSTKQAPTHLVQLLELLVLHQIFVAAAGRQSDTFQSFTTYDLAVRKVPIFSLTKSL